MEGKKHATVKEVAQEAGVSVATVSAYMNGRKIRPENYQKVEHAVKKLNYVPNAVAKSLKVQISRTVGLLAVPQSGMDCLISALAQILRASGYRLLTMIAEADPKENQQTIKFFLDQNIDGLILWNVSFPEHFHLPAGLPTLTIDEKLPGLPSVSTDEPQAIERAVEFFLEQDISSIGYIFTDSGHRFSDIWWNSFEETMKKHRLPAHRYPSDSIGEEKVYLAEPGLSQEELIRLQESAELCLLSVDISPSCAKMLLTVHHLLRPMEKIGESAGELILQQMESPENSGEDRLLSDTFCEKKVTLRDANSSASKNTPRKIDYFLL